MGGTKMGIVVFGGKSLGLGQQLMSLSFCNLARAVAWGKEMGYRANPSQRIFGKRPKIKQLRPMMRFVSLSNSVK